LLYVMDCWAYQEPDVTLAELIEQFHAFGFDGVSVGSEQFLELDAHEADSVAALLRERGLIVTVHSNFRLKPLGAQRLIECLGDSLYSITFDAATVAGASGVEYDAARMSALLQEIIAISQGTQLRVGVEDFPLDRSVIDLHAEHLQPLLESPRYGMLLDVGHLNLRLRADRASPTSGVAESVGRVPVPIVELHLHDNRGERDDHAHIGFGSVPFEQVAAGLRSIGFDGVSTFEITPRYHGSTPADSKPRARESLNRWKALWEA
jgi:sugar phosphate isomerase/epimerase